MHLNTQPSSGHGPATPAQVLQYFFEGRAQDFQNYLTDLPEEIRLDRMKEMIALAYQMYDKPDADLVCRRIAHHPDYTKYWEIFPYFWQQIIFVTNLPFLKTRVNMSFMDHPQVMRKSVDYTIVIVDHLGNTVFQKNDTILARKTLSFEIDKLVNSDFHFGMLAIQTSERHLQSLRIYAHWYNENSITTTHEKGALANSHTHLVYPIVIANENLETYIAVSNTTDENLDARFQLRKGDGTPHPSELGLNLKARHSIFFPLSSHFNDMSSFFAEGPGALYLMNNGKIGAYYYFIHNKKLNTWQIQHL